MNRKIVAIVLASLSLLLFCIALYFGGLAKNFNSYYVPEDSWNSILNSRKENSELDLNRFKLRGYTPSIAGDKIYYSIVEQDKNPYDPIVSLGNGLKMAVHGEHISRDSIENNVSTEIVFYTKNEYRKMELVSTTLPILNIDFDNISNSSPETREDDPFKMTLFDNRGKSVRRLIKTDGRAHRRGNASFYAEKASMSLKFTKESVGENTRDNPMPLLGMPESDSWILAGMNYDYEKVRDAFAAKLWAISNKNSFNVKNSFEFRYVEVIINGDYSGLYLLGNKPTPSAVASALPDPEHPDIMFKIEDMDDIESFVTDQTDSLIQYKQETKVDENIAREVLRNYFKATYGSDTLAIERTSDMENAVDFNIFVNFTQNLDIPRSNGSYKNAYISFKWDGEKYKAILTPWDFDIALGTNNLFGEYYDIDPESNNILAQDALAALRRNGSDLGSRLASDRFIKLRQGPFSNKVIDEIIDELQADIYDSGAFRRNQERWPKTNHGDPGVKLNDFRNHMHRRAEYLVGYYSGGNLDNEPVYEIPNYVTEYLNTGVLLSPDDPNYYKIQEEPTFYEEPILDSYWVY